MFSIKISYILKYFYSDVFFLFQGDVVVLGKNSPIGVGKGRESENARYCDIEFINNNMMVKPINHLGNTAANDFLTVLSSQTGNYASL